MFRRELDYIFDPLAATAPPLFSRMHVEIGTYYIGCCRNTPIHVVLANFLSVRCEFVNNCTLKEMFLILWSL